MTAAKRALMALAFSTALVNVGELGAARAAETAEVIHWWTSGGESAAVKQFQQAFDKAGGQWVDAAVAGGEAARTAGINRIVGGQPPAAMQFNTSKQFDDLVSQGFLATLDEQAGKDGWTGKVNPVVLGAVTREGHIYGVPVNIHSNNWLWYSPEALKKAGAEPPKAGQSYSWDEFFAAGDKLKAAGLVPMAQSGDNWTLLLTFNDVLLSQGKELYLKVYQDKSEEAIRSPEFHKVAETIARLRDYTDSGMQGRQWNQATAMVINGQAGFNFMGDWAKGEILAAGKVPGRDIGCSPGVGKQVYWIGGDVFVFPKQKGSDGATAAQNLLAHVMLQPEVQVAFNLKKGSVPVRGDVDTSGLDACAQAGLDKIKSGDYVPNADLLVSPDVVGSLQDMVGQFFADKNKTADDFVAGFAKAMGEAM